MGWKAEFGEKWDVPAFVEFLVSKGILEDISWHNDVSPRFSLIREEPSPGGNKQFMVDLWVDHPIQSRREYQDTRYVVTEGESGTEPEYSKTFAELEDALQALFNRIPAFLEKRAEAASGPKKWSPKMSPNAPEWDSPEDYLSDLIQEHYSGRR